MFSMNRLTAAAAAVLASVSSYAQYQNVSDAYSDLYDSETVASFKRHVSFVTAAQLEGRKAALLHEFGAVAVAGTVDRAINYLAWLESVARKTLRASLIGTPIVIPMGSPHAKE